MVAKRDNERMSVVELGEPLMKANSRSQSRLRVLFNSLAHADYDVVHRKIEF